MWCLILFNYGEEHKILGNIKLEFQINQIHKYYLKQIILIPCDLIHTLHLLKLLNNTISSVMNDAINTSYVKTIEILLEFGMETFKILCGDNSITNIKNISITLSQIFTFNNDFIEFIELKKTFIQQCLLYNINEKTIADIIEFIEDEQSNKLEI